eukprot:403372848
MFIAMSQPINNNNRYSVINNRKKSDERHKRVYQNNQNNFINNPNKSINNHASLRQMDGPQNHNQEQLMIRRQDISSQLKQNSYQVDPNLTFYKQSQRKAQNTTINSQVVSKSRLPLITQKPFNPHKLETSLNHFPLASSHQILDNKLKTPEKGNTSALLSQQITKTSTTDNNNNNRNLFRILLNKEENKEYRGSYLQSNLASFKTAYKVYKRQKIKNVLNSNLMQQNNNSQKEDVELLSVSVSSSYSRTTLPKYQSTDNLNITAQVKLNHQQLQDVDNYSLQQKDDKNFKNATQLLPQNQNGDLTNAKLNGNCEVIFVQKLKIQLINGIKEPREPTQINLIKISKQQQSNHQRNIEQQFKDIKFKRSNSGSIRHISRN